MAHAVAPIADFSVAAQSVAVVDPAFVHFFPAVHIVHSVAPDVEKVPAGHVMSPAAKLGANLPAAALLHALEVAVGAQIAYRPDMQAVTTPPAWHREPAGQVSQETLALPAVVSKMAL